MTNVPVSGSVLKWAREFRGYKEAEAAELLGVTTADLRDYESEKRQPSVTMFERFATRYQLPPATLFLSEPPEVPKAPVDFRSVGGKKAKALSGEFGVALSEVRTLLHNYEKAVGDDEEFVSPKLTLLTLDDDPEQAGERARREFGISAVEQLGWKPDKAFSHWRALVEARGVLVFQQKFPITDGRGFSLFEDANAPCIVINREETTRAARTFTLWHEYCHLLLRRPGVSDHNFSDRTEAFCNRFAAAFLMPTDALRSLLPRWPNQPVEWSETDIARWASRLKVSRRALALRLEQLGIAPSGFNKKFDWTHPNRRKAQESGGNHVATRLSDIGSGYVETVLKALDRGAIDNVQTAQALGLSDSWFEEARKYVRSRRGVGVAA